MSGRERESQDGGECQWSESRVDDSCRWRKGEIDSVPNFLKEGYSINSIKYIPCC